MGIVKSNEGAHCNIAEGGEFWITREEKDIGVVQMLFVYGGEGQFIPIHCMTDEEMPDNIQGD